MMKEIKIITTMITMVMMVMMETMKIMKIMKMCHLEFVFWFYVNSYYFFIALEDSFLYPIF